MGYFARKIVFIIPQGTRSVSRAALTDTTWPRKCLLECGEPSPVTRRREQGSRGPERFSCY